MAETKIALFTDSGCDIDDNELREREIGMIPLRLHYSNGDFRDRAEITARDVYSRLPQEIPRTSLPDAGDITKLFDQYKEQGITDVLYVSISGNLSGTKNFVRLLADDYPELHVHIYDTCALSYEQGFLVLAADDDRKNGLPIGTILNHLGHMRENMLGLFVVRTLEYLKKGGRIGRVEGTLGTLLDIKPVIGCDASGTYYSLHRTRGFQRALRRMIDTAVEKFKGKSVRLAVVHGDVAQEAASLAQELKSLLCVRDVVIAPVSPVLGAHSGPGLLGIIAYETP
ncbi:MAG: DegV family protein [Eubacteriales bacterium]|nr:DegV family protein [Eubacteriales bacterium]